MGMSKKDLSRQKQNLVKRIAELEPKVRLDPLKKHTELHEELAKLRKDLAAQR